MFLAVFFCQFLFSSAVGVNPPTGRSALHTALLNQLDEWTELRRKSQFRLSGIGDVANWLRETDYRLQQLPSKNNVRTTPWFRPVFFILHGKQAEVLPEDASQHDRTMIEKFRMVYDLSQNKVDSRKDEAERFIQHFRQFAFLSSIIDAEYYRHQKDKLPSDKQSQIDRFIASLKQEGEALGCPEFFEIWQKTLQADPVSLQDNRDCNLSCHSDDDDKLLVQMVFFGVGITVTVLYFLTSYCLRCWYSATPQEGMGTPPVSPDMIQPVLDLVVAALPQMPESSPNHHAFRALSVGSPEEMWGTLINNTAFSAAGVALLSTPASFNGCSNAAQDAMKILKQTGTAAGNFFCRLRLLAGQLSGGCNVSSNPPPAVNLTNGAVVCTNGGETVPPGFMDVWMGQSGPLSYWQFSHNPQLPAVSTSTQLAFPPTSTPTTEVPTTLTPSTPPNTISNTGTSTGTGTGTGTGTETETSTGTGTPTDTDTGTSTTPAPTAAPTTTLAPTATPAPLPSPSQLYWANASSAIVFANISSSVLVDHQVVVQSNSTFPYNPEGLYVDRQNNNIYWTIYNGPSGMYVAAIDPSNPAKVSNIKRLISGGSGLIGVAVDPTNGKIYYSGYPVTIRVGSINANNPSTPTGVTSISSQYTRAIALDLLRGRIYWTNWDNANYIWVGDVVLQNPTAITNSRQLATVRHFTFMSIDFTRGCIYLRDESALINRVQLNLTVPSALTNTTVAVTAGNTMSSSYNSGGIFVY